MVHYFRFCYYLGIKPDELDDMDSTLVEGFDILLDKVNEGSGKERDEFKK